VNGLVVWNLDGTRRVLYRLHELVNAPAEQPVYKVEGEKDADRLKSLGLLATTNPGGANEPWREEYSQTLKGRRVYIIPDNDEPGREHARKVAEALQGVATGVTVVELPGLPPKGDVSDWLDANGNDKERLLQLVMEAARTAEESVETGEATPARRDEEAGQLRALAKHIHQKYSHRCGQQRQPTHYQPLPPYRPFPVKALPESVAAYVGLAAQALGCDPAFVALPALSALAAMIGTSRTIRLKSTWTEPSVVWSAIIGESGTLKSPALDLAVGFLPTLQEELRRHSPACRVLCADVTIERLAEILEDNPRGVLLARDELNGWLGSFIRYKGKAGGSDLPHWLELHRAGPVFVDRKTGTRRELSVPRAAVSVTGGIQPAVLARALTADHQDSGLLARLLLAMPPRLPKRWSDAEVSSEVRAAYELLLRRLHQLHPLRDEQGRPSPLALELTPDARAAWIDFYVSWACAQAGATGELAAAYAKLEGYAARLALVHHVASCAARGEEATSTVAAVSILAGVELVRWLAAEACRVYVVLAETEEQRQMRSLVEWISRRRGRTSVRDLQKSNSRRYPTAAHAESALQALVADGLGSWHDRLASDRGGHPTRDFVLTGQPPSDTADTTDTTDTTPDDHADAQEEAR
jgi:hypothetical protein